MVGWISLLISLVTAFSLYLVVRELYFVKLHATNPRPRVQSQGPLVGSKVDGLLPNELVNRISEQMFTAILFTSSGCATCKAVRLEELESISARYKETCQILEVTDELRDRKFLMNLLESNEVTERLGIQVVPHLLILNKTGIVLKNFLVNNPEQVETAIDSLDETHKAK